MCTLYTSALAKINGVRMKSGETVFRGTRVRISINFLNSDINKRRRAAKKSCFCHFFLKQTLYFAVVNLRRFFRRVHVVVLYQIPRRCNRMLGDCIESQQNFFFVFNVWTRGVCQCGSIIALLSVSR